MLNRTDLETRPLAEITVVEAEACHFCHDARMALDELTADYPLRIRTLDMREPAGFQLMQEHRAALSPLILIDGAFFSQGRLPRGKIKQLLEARAAAVRA